MPLGSVFKPNKSKSQFEILPEYIQPKKKIIQKSTKLIIPGKKTYHHNRCLTISL